MLGRGKEIKHSLGFTPRAKKVLENAFLEAKRIIGDKMNTIIREEKEEPVNP